MNMKFRLFSFGMLCHRTSWQERRYMGTLTRLMCMMYSSSCVFAISPSLHNYLHPLTLLCYGAFLHPIIYTCSKLTG